MAGISSAAALFSPPFSGEKVAEGRMRGGGECDIS